MKPSDVRRASYEERVAIYGEALAKWLEAGDHDASATTNHNTPMNGLQQWKTLTPPSPTPVLG